MEHGSSRRVGDIRLTGESEDLEAELQRILDAGERLRKIIGGGNTCEFLRGCLMRVRFHIEMKAVSSLKPRPKNTIYPMRER
jgi:hypothetical protein